MNNSFSIKTKLVKSKEYLFDELRKKWIMSTPEEIVRQKFWKYLNIEKKYPMSLIAIEKQIKLIDLFRFPMVRKLVKHLSSESEASDTSVLSNAQSRGAARRAARRR